MKFVLASHNKGKLLEMQTILSDLDVEICTLDELGIDIDVDEDGKTFEENSLKKALAVMYKTGLPAIADDSGLCVEEMGGAPGVYSARYGGVEAPSDSQRNALILQALRDQSNRTAKFVCVVTCCFPIGMALATRGECEGMIAFVPKGNQGFGYDTIFQPKGELRTFAEMSSQEKNAISHRGNALRCFRKGLEEFLQTQYRV